MNIRDQILAGLSLCGRSAWPNVIRLGLYEFDQLRLHARGGDFNYNIASMNVEFQCVPVIRDHAPTMAWSIEPGPCDDCDGRGWHYKALGYVSVAPETVIERNPDGSYSNPFKGDVCGTCGGKPVPIITAADIERREAA